MNDTQKVAMLFIGGTGRSGTTICKKLLCESDEIGTVGSELRLFVDYHGITDLYRVLVETWDPFRATAAINEFLCFWDSSFTTSRLPRLLRGLSGYVGMSPLRYRQIRVSRKQKKLLSLACNKFLKMVGVSLESATWYGSPSFKMRPQFYDSRLVPTELFSYAAEVLIADMADAFSPNKVIKYLVDDTPYSIMSYSMLKKIFRKAKFINIVRHPLDVFCSYGAQRWACNSYSTLERLRAVYERLELLEDSADCDDFLTLKLEELTDDVSANLMLVADFLGVQNQFDGGDVSLNTTSFRKYKQELHRDILMSAHDTLSHQIKRYGYEYDR
jgi:hypothetical protein